MTVVIPFHGGDRDQALRLIEWIQFLGPQPGRFFLMTQAKLQDPAILPAGWEWLTDYLDIKANWKDLKDASAANAMWTQTAREMCRLQAGPWLWLEPDALPLTRDWLSALAEEHRRGGKPFTGGHAPGNDGRMSGVAIYDQNTSRICRLAMQSGHVAFDYFGAEDFKRQGIHFTPLICDQFRCDPFRSQEDFDARVPLQSAIHHGDKTGSIYEFAEVSLMAADVTEKEQRRLQSAKEKEEYDKSPEAAARARSVADRLRKMPIFVRVPDRPDEITDMLNQRMAEQEKSAITEALNDTARFNPQAGVNLGLMDQFPFGMKARLEWIMQQVGEDKKRRAKLYEALQAHGIECGRKKRKQKTKK